MKKVILLAFALQFSLCAPAQVVRGNVSINGNVTVSLPGSIFSSSPSSVSFGNVQSGGASSKTVVVSNVGSGQNLIISTVSSSNSLFAISSNTCASQSIIPGATCGFTLTFSPTATGAQSGHVTIADNAGNPDTISFSGTGIPGVPGFSYNPPATFGNVQSGNSSTITETITNPSTATATLTIGTISSNNSKFTLASDLCSSHGILPNGTCTFNLTFSPTATGSQTATITIPDNAGNPDTIAASGTGTAVPVPSISNPMCTTPPCALTAASSGFLYSFAFTASGGTPGYAWSFSSGTPPTGISLNSATGVLSGTASTTGTTSLTVKVTDSNSQTATLAITLTVNANTAVASNFSNSSWNKQPPIVWPPTDSNGSYASLTGARVWDDSVKWCQLFPTSSTASTSVWNLLSNFVNTYATNANTPMDVLYTFGCTPPWAAMSGTDSNCSSVSNGNTVGSSCAPTSDIDGGTCTTTVFTGCGTGADAIWQNAVYQIVSTFKGKIHYYECWNEPDGAGNFWSNSTVFQGTGHSPLQQTPPLIRLVRMCYDMEQIVHQIDPSAVVLSVSFHGPTALGWMHYFANTTVAQPGCTGACSSAIGGATWSASTVSGAQTFDVFNAHMRGNGSANINPESFLTSFSTIQQEVQNDSLNTSNNCGFDDEWGPVANLGSGQANVDILASYVARGLILRASVSNPCILRTYYYQWDANAGPGSDISALQGNIAGLAWDVVTGWLKGNEVSADSLSGTVYQVPVLTPSGVNEIAAWDTSTNCNSGCTTNNHTFAGYGHYYDVTGALNTAPGGVVPLGLKPVLVVP